MPNSSDRPIRSRQQAWLSSLCTTLLLAFMAISMFPGIATAANKNYIVEVLVFENRDADNSKERWRNLEDFPAVDQAVSLAGNSAGFVQLTPNQLELTGAANVLKRSGRYRILLHKGWQQPGLSKKMARPVRLNTPAGMLDGTIRLEQGRYLYLYIDLVMGSRSGFSGTNGIRLKQQRRVRKKELHYFDHPRFSVIAVVRDAAG